MFISNRNRRGVLAFISFLIILVFVPRILMNFTSHAKIELTATEVQLAKQQFKQEEAKHLNWKNKKWHSRYNIPPSSFNPNHYTMQDWMYLGLSEKQAQVVLKFTRYGVQSNQELKRIFVIPDELYQLIKDSTRYDETQAVGQKTIFENKNKPNKINIIDLNRATQEDLEQLKGIGPFFSKRIIAFRNKLGGFYSKEQLREVYQITEEQYQQIQYAVLCNNHDVTRININQITPKELVKHPYFNWNLANALCKMRDQLGGFKALEDLKKSHLVTDDVFERIKNYVKLN